MQNVDLYQPIAASRVGAPPLVLRVLVQPNNNNVVGGVPQNSAKSEAYILLSALPSELQERVKTAVQALINGM
jgi:hypothetical protein